MAATYQPKDDDERLASMGACVFQNRKRALARLYLQVFAASPQLAEDLQAGHRYRAACAAALAGCGLGKDATDLSPDERIRLRKLALGWLNAQLTAMQESVTGTPGNRILLRQHLYAWLADPELAELRESRGLSLLPEAERADWLTLWKKVHALIDRAAGA